MMMRAAGRANTDGTSTAHTVVERLSGIQNNSNCDDSDQDAAPASTTNYQTMSLSTELSNYEQRSQSYNFASS
jgi:hypothetical protein